MGRQLPAGMGENEFPGCLSRHELEWLMCEVEGDPSESFGLLFDRLGEEICSTGAGRCIWS